jgi:hypothetical protein
VTKNFGLSHSHTSNSTLDVSTRPSTSGLNTGHSSSESNLHRVSLVEIKPSPKAEALTEGRRQKSKERDVLADTPVKVALQIELGQALSWLKVTDYSVIAKTNHENLNN